MTEFGLSDWDRGVSPSWSARSVELVVHRRLRFNVTSSNLEQSAAACTAFINPIIW